MCTSCNAHKMYNTNTTNHLIIWNSRVNLCCSIWNGWILFCGNKKMIHVTIIHALNVVIVTHLFVCSLCHQGSFVPYITWPPSPPPYNYYRICSCMAHETQRQQYCHELRRIRIEFWTPAQHKTHTHTLTLILKKKPNQIYCGEHFYWNYLIRDLYPTRIFVIHRLHSTHTSHSPIRLTHIVREVTMAERINLSQFVKCKMITLQIE